MTRCMILVLAAFLTGCCCTQPPPPIAPRPTSDQIEFSIDFAEKYVLAHQEIAWPPNNPANDPVAVRRTALVTYALLAAGFSPDDPHCQPILAVLKNARNPGPYTRGLRMQIWQLLWEDHHDQQLQDLASADAAALLKSVHSDGPLVGIWSASVPPATQPSSADYAATQSAVAGLGAMDQMGGEIPDMFWRHLDQSLRSAQRSDGSWSDGGTAFELSSLLAVQPILARNAGLACKGNINNDAVGAGLAWIGQHFDQFKTLDDYSALEQIGDATGHRYFGNIDWFNAIADRLIKTQLPDGSWAETGGSSTTSLDSTAYGMLFLARGSAPVAFEKLDYSSPGKPAANWNERPSDVRNLTRWIADESEARLNWQLADLSTSLDDLHAAPVLYLAGSKRFNLPDAAVAKLRQFVLEGGLILGNADCDSPTFKKSFIDLGRKMFPIYEFRDLSLDDILFTGEVYRPNKMRRRFPILGLTNGVREMMLLFPYSDPSRRWQANSPIIHSDEFRIGANIFFYASDVIGLRTKTDSYLVHPDPSIHPTRTLRLARLMVGDNPDPEPAGWPRLAAILHNAPYRLDLEVTAVKPGDSLAGYQIVHLTGTAAFTLAPPERAALVDFVRRGGTLIIDAAGGSGAFADAAEKELGTMFGNGGGNRLAPLPAHGLPYNLPEAPIDQVRYRRFAKRTMIGDLKSPRLGGIQVGGRYAVFFSRLDLSAGLVGEQIDGIDGYSPDSATDLMRNLILYSTGR